MDRPDSQFCPECEGTENLDRRNFIRVVGGTASAVAAGSVIAPAALADAPAAAPAARAPRPAEALIRELYQSLSAEQRGRVVRPWDHGAGRNQVATRLRMYNAPIGQRIGAVYNQQQQELVGHIVRAICSDEEGYRRVSRNGRFDNSGSLAGCGADIFGDPSGNGQFALVFTSHHLTIRCDGNSEPNAAFGGPMYYGHSAHGLSDNNVWHYQTETVQEVFDALNEQQRRSAVVTGNNPGEGPNSIRFREAGQARPGIAASELTADQRRLVETVMRNLLSPFRREDGDEVMQILRQNGGLQRLHLAFYRNANAQNNSTWTFWRLEGPGFVWNYRVLPHVHCFVKIAGQPAQANNANRDA